MEGQDRSGLPSKDGLLARERLNTLLEQGVKHMLVTVAAGPAYGKTQLVASFVRERRCRLAWQRIKRLDNLPSRFWRSVIRATTAELPVLAERLEELGYPDTVSKFDTFLRILADELYVGEEVICVVDDFHVLENPDIRRFFEYLVEANLENFCLILISGTKINLNVTGLRDIAFSITAEELKFTREEAEALFAMYNIALPPAQIEKIEKNVNGWPLALYLLALQLHEHPDRYDESIASSSFVVNQVFERECFSGYSDVVRKLLIKLSLIQGFSPEIVRTLAGDDAEAAFLELDQNTFILFDHVVRLHVFQNVYHKFLAEKQVCLTEEERREVYLTAARSFVEHGQTLEAIDCFEICGMYEEMLSAILAFTGTRMGMNVGHANYLLEKLDLLPEELVKSKPIVTYLRAFIYLNNVEVEKSLELFTELETRLQGDDAPEARVMLGEVYYMIGALHMMKNDEEFPAFFAKAREVLPNGSSMRLTGNLLLVENNNHFSLADNRPGARERMEKAAFEGMTDLIRVANGSGSGMQYLFLAESAYNTYNFKQADEQAYRAILAAREYDQHDIYCNAHIVLAESALFQGNYKATAEHIEHVVDYINRREVMALYDLRDYAQSWFYLKMGAPERMSGWIIEPLANYRDRPPITVGRDLALHTGYLLVTEKYTALLPMLDWLEGLYKRRGLWISRLHLHLLRAYAYLRIGEEEKAIESFYTAYDMSYANGIVTPFLEVPKAMRTLIDHARRQTNFSFDSEWLSNIYHKAMVSAKRLAALDREYNKGKRAIKAPDFHLSKREMEILNNLSQGLTREEIADELGVSINTVKSTIKSIYNKLGAINRADAVRIAVAVGVLE